MSDKERHTPNDLTYMWGLKKKMTQVHRWREQMGRCQRQRGGEGEQNG